MLEVKIIKNPNMFNCDDLAKLVNEYLNLCKDPQLVYPVFDSIGQITNVMIVNKHD